MYNAKAAFLVNYIRYESLYTLIQSSNAVKDGINYTNLYIDLKSILNEVKISESLKNCSITHYEVVSLVVNLIAHYNAFFAKYYVLNTTYIVHPDKTETQEIKDILKDVQFICSIIPSAHYITGNFDSDVMIYSLLGMEYGNPTSHIILSKNESYFQFVNYMNCTILRPVKNNQSYYVNKSNLYTILYGENNDIEFSTELSTLLWSMHKIGNLYNNVLIPIKMCIDIINIGVRKGYILNRHSNDIRSLIRNLCIQEIYPDMDTYQIELRYFNIDVVYKYLNQKHMNIDNIVLSCIKTINNPNALKKLNNECFKGIELDLDRM